MRLQYAKSYLPEFPRTRHLPYHPNAQRDDLVASEEEAHIVFDLTTFVEEKIDGSNVGICWHDKEEVFLVRNRDHILDKAYCKTQTSSKLQYRPVWNWAYDRKKQFQDINDIFGEPVGVYGEWTYALHGRVYTHLPSYFIPFDIYVPSQRYFLATNKTREIFDQVGLPTTPLLYSGVLKTYSDLDNILYSQSSYSNVDQREGLYLKVCDFTKVIARFKMVHRDYSPGYRWDNTTITKQGLLK